MYALQQRQGLPIKAKILFSELRIREWYNHWEGQVYVAFSGGKDSTVLLHLVRSQYPKVPAVFVDTGLEFPEIRDFVKSIDNVIWVKPKKTFKQTIEQYGYPVISKDVAHKVKTLQNPTERNVLNTAIIRGKVKGKIMGRLSKKWLFLENAPFKISDYCCDILKKNPVKAYEKESGRKGFIGVMASDSLLRQKMYLKNGCNVFNGTQPLSRPLSIWLEDDIWEYIKQNQLKYSSIYDMGYNRTGCAFCMFGIHMEKGENRFDKMKRTHPKMYDYCMNNLGLKEVLRYIGATK